jgi:hypothetical protein
MGFLDFFVSFSVMDGPLGNRGLWRALVVWVGELFGEEDKTFVMYVGEILASSVCAAAANPFGTAQR